MALDSETEMFCTLYLFKDVQNSDKVREKVMSGDLRCSIIKAALIVDPLQVVVAANKAAINANTNQLTTKSLYTEVLFNLSVSKNITRTLAEFGINDKDKHIIIALIHRRDEEKPISEAIMDSIDGERVSISRLHEFTDIDLVKKIYKIENDELNVSSLTNSIVSRISCKDFASLK